MSGHPEREGQTPEMPNSAAVRPNPALNGHARQATAVGRQNYGHATKSKISSETARRENEIGSRAFPRYAKPAEDSVGYHVGSVHNIYMKDGVRPCGFETKRSS
jgi:hypothetical protein